MDLDISKADLIKALQPIQGIADRRTTMPVLSNLLLEAGGEAVEFSATDLEVSVRTRSAASVKAPGKAVVSARKAFEAARAVASDRVRLRSAEGGVRIEGGTAKIELVALPPGDFPTLPTFEGGGTRIEMKAEIFAQTVDRTSFCISDDETRYNLSGVYCVAEAGGDGTGLKVVSTDGHRLSVVATGVTLPKGVLQKGIIIPRKGIAEVRRSAEETPGGSIEVFLREKDVSFKVGGTAYAVRLIEGEFPEYKHVVPKSPGRTVHVKRSDLHDSVRRMVILNSQSFPRLELKLTTGKALLRVEVPGLGRGEDELAVDFKGEPIHLGFNFRYLTEVLDVFAGETLSIGLTDEQSPVLFEDPKDPTFQHVIMPMRL